MAQWIILVHRIPPRPLYLRAKMRQRLASVGAVAVKNAVYVLPDGPETLEDFQWIAQEITAGGGDAHLFHADFVDSVANDDTVAQFRDLRNADYEVIASEAHVAMKSARSAAAVEELTQAHARILRRMEEVMRIDFFAAPARAQAEKSVEAIEARLKRDRTEEKIMVKAHPELRGKAWVTRPGVKIDRMASAWFIRRFVDPKANFRFVGERDPRRDGEIRFDMAGGDFTHEEDRCTFETLVRRVGLPDKGVRAIAEIVHDIDLKEDRFARPETTGVRTLMEGVIARYESDEARIDRGMAIFDDLHEALAKRGGRRGKGASR